MKLLILTGPNLNLLGSREPAIYGSESYDALCQQIQRHAAAIGCTVTLRQSTHEGAQLDAIQGAQGVYGGIVINPGAYAHYSYAIYDALRAVDVPAVEVHISDVDAREPFRRVSNPGMYCETTLAGHGFDGYLEAIDHLLAARSPRP